MMSEGNVNPFPELVGIAGVDLSEIEEVLDRRPSEIAMHTSRSEGGVHYSVVASLGARGLEDEFCVWHRYVMLHPRNIPVHEEVTREQLLIATTLAEHLWPGRSGTAET